MIKRSLVWLTVATLFTIGWCTCKVFDALVALNARIQGGAA